MAWGTAVGNQILALKDERLQRDFPVVCRHRDGSLIFAYIEHDGTSDVLWLGRESEQGLQAKMAVSEPGIIHQPALAVDGSGTVWCFWGQTGDDDIVHLMARPVKELRGFQRVTLQPGETRTVSFELGEKDFRFWNADMQRIVEPGDFEIMSGANSRDVKSATLTVTE